MRNFIADFLNWCFPDYLEDERKKKQHFYDELRKAKTVDVSQRGTSLVDDYKRLYDAIVEHHSQKADDRCIEDDDKLYAAASLPPCDRHVGSTEAMLHNCQRFIQNRCKGGKWPSYVELENEITSLKLLLTEDAVLINKQRKEIQDLNSHAFGHDVRGPGNTEDGNGFPCNCHWSSIRHGDTCPEHGRKGIRIETKYDLAIKVCRLAIEYDKLIQQETSRAAKRKLGIGGWIEDDGGPLDAAYMAWIEAARKTLA